MSLSGTLTKTLLLSFILVVVSCAAPPASPQPSQQPWRISEPEDEGVDPEKLDQMMEVVEALSLPVDSVVVIRHGRLVFESYPNPEYGPDDMHLLYSVTKSFTSALIGIAIEQGYIESVDQKVVDFFPDWNINNLDSRKRDLTIEHLLTMSCGFEWEGPDDSLHTWGKANFSGNPVKYVLNLPMASDPGTAWQYNGGCSHILSAILTKTSELSTLEFARQHLFEPLGITQVKWPRDPQGIYYGGQDIWLTPRDMAKFGQLFLNQGIWEGRKIIPADWVARSVETHMLQVFGGYGYQWWTFPQSGIYYASGAYEQKIYVVPELDMVVVFTADNKAGGLKQGEMRDGPPMTDWLLGHFILPSCDTYAALEYAKYGFSLEIPMGMHEQELGKSWQGTASDDSGLIQFSFGSSPYESVGIQWDTAEDGIDLNSVLEAFSEAVQSMGTEVDVIGQPVSTTKGDHELIYQSFEVEERGYRYPGISGAWYCDRAGRSYLLYYATIPENAERNNPLTTFQRYLESFTCH